MNECAHIGLDVHKDTIAVAVLRPGTTEADERVVPNTPEATRRLLARLHRAGELTSVRVPGAAEEAVRDLIRVREEVKCDRRIARQRIRSFLLRYGCRYPGPRDAWSSRFEVWARSVTFDEPLATEAFKNLLSAYFIRDAQLAEMGRRIEEIASRETFATDVARLSALRGISTTVGDPRTHFSPPTSVLWLSSGASAARQLLLSLAERPAASAVAPMPILHRGSDSTRREVDADNG